MNDLNNVIENFYQDVQQLHAEYDALIGKIEAVATRESKEKTVASLSQKVSVTTENTNTVRENDESTESVLETYLDEVIKKASDLRIKNCKLDFEEELIPDDHELSSLASETRSSSKNEELSSKSSSSRRVFTKEFSKDKSAPSPMSARERAKAYKPPPLPKKKGFQTTYGTSFRPTTPRTGSNSSSRTAANPTTKFSGSHDTGPEVAKTRKASVNETGRSCNSTSRSEFLSESGDVDSMTSETSTLVNADSLCVSETLSSSPTKVLPLVFENSVDPESSKSEISVAEQSYSVDIWPPVLSKKQKQAQFLEINTAADKILKLHQKLIYSSRQYSSLLSAEIEKSEAIFVKHANSFSAGREMYRKLVEIEKQLNNIENEILDAFVSSESVSDFSRNRWESLLQNLDVSLSDVNQILGVSTSDPLTMMSDSQKVSVRRNILKNVLILETVFGDSESQNLSEKFLKKVSEQDMQKVELRFRTSVLEFELKLQQIVSEILDDILSDEQSANGAAKNIDLVKFLYSIVNNGGNKLPNFVYNDS